MDKNLISILEKVEVIVKERDKIKAHHDSEINLELKDIKPSMTRELEQLLEEVAEESNDQYERSSLKVYVTEDGKIRGTIRYNEDVTSFFYEIDGKHITDWVNQRFKKKLEEKGIPAKYFDRIILHYPLP